jgi:hypothetical protein
LVFTIGYFSIAETSEVDEWAAYFQEFAWGGKSISVHFAIGLKSSIT